MKIIKFEANIENLHYPIITLEDGTKKKVNTIILRRIYGGCSSNTSLNEVIIGEQFDDTKILEEYQKEAKITIPELKKKIENLKLDGIKKGFYKYLDMRGKYLWEVMKQLNLLGQLQ
jgi:hypothetical protein